MENQLEISLKSAVFSCFQLFSMDFKAKAARTKPFSNKLSTAVTSQDESTCKMVIELYDGHKAHE